MGGQQEGQEEGQEEGQGFATWYKAPRIERRPDQEDAR